MRNCHYFLAWVLLISIHAGLRAQNLPFQEIRRLYSEDPEVNPLARQMIVSHSGGFLVAGGFDQQGFIARLNDCGDTLWLKTYLFGEATAFHGITELPSGSIAAVGSCVNCAPGDTTRKALAGIFDPGGNLLRDTTLGRFNFSATAYAVISTSDGKVALTGSFVWAWAGGFAPSRAFLAVLDENLHVDVWSEHNALAYDVPQALAQAPDGGFVLAGYSIAVFFGPTQAQLFRTDAQGQLLWTHTSGHLHSRFNSVQITSSGAIAALGWRQADTTGTKKSVYLAVHDLAAGSLLLERDYEGSNADDEGRSLHVVEGGFLVGALWGEPRDSIYGRRDWIFRLDENFDREGAGAFFDSALFTHDLVNVVPLSPDGRDYAYLSHRALWGAGRHLLFYKKTRRGHHIQLTQAAVHYQLVPRNTATNLGTVTYAGALQTPGAYEQVRLDVWRNDVLWQTNFAADPGQFSFQVPVPAELANYTFQLWGIAGGNAYPEADACSVVAGDAYIIQGQSNAVANTPLFTADSARLHYANPFVRNFGQIASDNPALRWRREADDNNLHDRNHDSGQWGLVMGSRIVQEQGVPVALINGGIGGIAIDQMMPNPAAPHSTAHSYGRFYQRMEQAGLRDNLRAILFFQGETNALPGYNETVQSYQNKYLQLRNYWQSDYDYEREYLFQIRPGCWSGNFPVIQEAQRRLPQVVSNLSLMSSTGMNHDGCHYHFENGYERAGNDMYRLIAKDLYQAPEMPNIYPPEVDSAWFSACDLTQITLRLRRQEDTYYWSPGWETDFRLEGAPATSILYGQMLGNTVVLTLSAPPAAGFSGLSYVSHVGGAEAPVKNANGIGMLAFYNMPIGMCPVNTSELSNSQNHVQVFPNPTNGTLVLHLPQSAQIALHNILGRQLMQGKYSAGRHTLQVEGPAGTYLLLIRTEQDEQTIRIIKR